MTAGEDTPQQLDAALTANDIRIAPSVPVLPDGWKNVISQTQT
jgi:hypothetical protein